MPIAQPASAKARGVARRPMPTSTLTLQRSRVSEYVQRHLNVKETARVEECLAISAHSALLVDRLLPRLR